MEHINDPNHTPKNAIFGANKHEGSFVLGSKKKLSLVSYL